MYKGNILVFITIFLCAIMILTGGLMSGQINTLTDEKTELTQQLEEVQEQVILYRNSVDDYKIEIKEKEDLIDKQGTLIVKLQQENKHLEEDLDREKTYYDTLTDEEIFLLCAAVEHEVGLFSPLAKEIVATCIYNRIKSPKFPRTVFDVLTQPNQFAASLDEYYCLTISEDTKEAVKKVFSSKNSIHDALYFYGPEMSAPSAIEWFENSGDVEFLFEYGEYWGGKVWRGRYFK